MLNYYLFNFNLVRKRLFYAGPMPEAAAVRQMAASQYLQNMMKNETEKIRGQTLLSPLTAPASTVVLSSAADGNYDSASAITAPPNKKLKMLAAMEPSQSASTSTDDYSHVISHEVTAYLSPLRLTDDEKSSPLIFWKNHAVVYPHLAMLARVYLTPCASSVPVEGLFSVTGLIKNGRRSSIAPYRLNKLCFVHDNYRKFFPL